jgi:hypothetical protein
MVCSSVNFTLPQYSETKGMHFLFNLLKIKGLYMFRALLAYNGNNNRKVSQSQLQYYIKYTMGMATCFGL